MDELIASLAMGRYGGYVWPAYAIATAVLTGLVWASLRRLRACEREVAALEAARPARPKRAGVKA
jgi:heme exporter protein D